MFFSKPEWPDVDVSAVRARATLVVIDDGQFPYLELFERDKYNIRKWDDVENLPELESGRYDVILLDLQGVGASHSAEQGLGVLKHLRAVAPTQIIIAYSDADWPLKYQEFFNMADAVLSKSSDYVDFKRSVDQFIAKRYSLDFYVERIVRAAGADAGAYPELAATARKAILARSTKKLDKYLRGGVIDEKRLGTMLSIAQTAIGVLQLALQLAGKN